MVKVGRKLLVKYSYSFGNASATARKVQKNSLTECQNWVSTRRPVHPLLLSRGVVFPFATLKVLALLQGVLLNHISRRK